MSIDYRRFLGRKDTRVLPYFGGTRVEAADRRLRVRGEPAPGWWSFAIEGRFATPVEAAEPAPLGELPAVRGHWAGGWLFAGGRDLDRIALPPHEEPAPLARCTGRRWHGGELLLESIDFEDDAEVDARAALEDGRPIDGVRGAPPSLRAAYGFALASAAGAAAGVPVSPREAAGAVQAIAAGGRPVADEFVRRLADERARWLAEQAASVRDQQLRSVAHGAAGRRQAADPLVRADQALEQAGARMLHARRLADDQLEVTFTCEGERFISVVDAFTLQVYDAGICLSGADRELTLGSLCSAIREAIEDGVLHITRHG